MNAFTHKMPLLVDIENKAQYISMSASIKLFVFHCDMILGIHTEFSLWSKQDSSPKYREIRIFQSHFNEEKNNNSVYSVQFALNTNGCKEALEKNEFF